MATKPQVNTVDFFIGLPKEFKPVMSSNNSNDDSGIKTVRYLLSSNEWSFDNDPDSFKKTVIMDILNDYKAP
jgi:hypothetical protein|tara:strand:- start:246 stop:461 length:216 start_codon:yes stop_codon:yes gene_type:complete